jgi:hypothetical protein
MTQTGHQGISHDVQGDERKKGSSSCCDVSVKKIQTLNIIKHYFFFWGGGVWYWYWYLFTFYISLQKCGNSHNYNE